MSTSPKHAAPGATLLRHRVVKAEDEESDPANLNLSPVETPLPITPNILGVERRRSPLVTLLGEEDRLSDSDASDAQHNCQTPSAQKIQLPPLSTPRVILAPGDPFHFWDYLQAEIFGVQDVDQADYVRRQRVHNFLNVPFQLERVRLVTISISWSLYSYSYCIQYNMLR